MRFCSTMGQIQWLVLTPHSKLVVRSIPGEGLPVWSVFLVSVIFRSFGFPATETCTIGCSLGLELLCKRDSKVKQTLANISNIQWVALSHPVMRH